MVKGMLKTKITEKFNIEYPIFQGGMAWVATAELAAAVSNAGALGIIGAGSMTSEMLDKEIKKAKSLTTKPFGVNLMLLLPHIEELIEVVIQNRVPVVTTGAGNPGPFVDRLKAAGIKVVPVVPSVALAKRMERYKVDAVIAEGNEAGGHIGPLTTMVLIPQIVREVNLPVIAAGGIATGEGLAAALCLGAEGVQMGTRFICATECTAHPAYKEAILKAKDRSTVVTGQSIGIPVRVLRNKLAQRYEVWEKEYLEGKRTKEEIEELGVGMLRKAVREGEVENGSVMAGAIAGIVNEIKPAREIIEEVVSQAELALKKALDKFNN